MLLQNTSVPLYKQIKDKLAADIHSGRLQIGERLPSEDELCDLYGVSRITVRNAITELAQEGFLVKKQGKGTFVQRPKIERKIAHLMSFTAACELNGMTSHSHVVKREIPYEYTEAKNSLGLSDKDSILYIQRVRHADDIPLMIENNYYSNERFGFLFNETLEGSLYDLLRTTHGIIPSDSHETTLEIVRASSEAAILLECPQGEPLFLMKTTVLDTEGRPIHYGEQYIIGSKYKFYI